MKSIIFSLILSFCTLTAHALEITVYGPSKILYQENATARGLETVESLSLRTIGKKLPIVANENGVIAIDNLKQDTSSPGRAAGWCYSIDGKMPSEGFRTHRLSAKNETLVWFYGVATQDAQGQWSECVPVFADSAYILK